MGNQAFSSYSHSIVILKKSFFILTFYMIFMTFVRLYLLQTNYLSTFPFDDLLSAFILGFRLDISILGYVFTPILLFLILSFVRSIFLNSI